MIDSKLNKEIGREFENLNRRKNKQIILVTAILLLIFTGIYFLEPAITGFITVEKQISEKARKALDRMIEILPSD